ncbi:MAG: hypothetical protein MUO70_04545 [Euryarchaeota archaeon]|nr:hypothetical protein [Euryarchaeota archaeon]
MSNRKYEMGSVVSKDGTAIGYRQMGDGSNQIKNPMGSAGFEPATSAMSRRTILNWGPTVVFTY